MTTYAPQATPGHWINAAELAHESGLREDLVRRFLPANNSGSVPLYSAEQIPLAKFVKRLTDMGTPASAIDVAVRDLRSNPGQGINLGPAGDDTSSHNRAWIAAGTAAVVALLAGGIVGGLIGAGNRSENTSASAPITVTAEAPPPQDVTIPTTPDPVCAEWGTLNDIAREKHAEWARTDPEIPADQWSAQQRELNLAVAPVLKDEAAALDRLADRASSPALRTLLKLQSQYESTYASRIPNYTPTDHKLWAAAFRFGDAVNSFCSAMAPR